MKQQEQNQYYTDQGVNVTSRIDSGKTKFLKSKFLAEWWANMRRSYLYEIFDSADQSKRNRIGYGVPR